MHKIRCYPILLALLAGSILMWTMPLEAQSIIDFTPVQLSIAAQRGAVKTRTLLLTVSEPVTGLRAVPLDLPGTTEEDVFPASAISVGEVASTLEANAPVTVPVTFDLRNVPSGRFSGVLLFTFDGGTLSVPVTVTIKDRPWFPFLALLLGVGLGLGVSLYRTRGRPRDQVVVRMGRVQTQLRSELDAGDAAQIYLQHVEAALVDAEVAFLAETWDVAMEHVERAEKLLTRWRKHRHAWLAQLAYYDKLIAWLEREVREGGYKQTLFDYAVGSVQAIPKMQDPSEFSDRLLNLSRYVSKYLTLDAYLDELASVVGSDSDLVESFRQRLDALTPEEQEAYDVLLAEIQSELETLTPKGPLRTLETMSVPQVPTPPLAPSSRGIVVAQLTDSSVSGAERRLDLFTLGSYVVTVLLLAVAGFVELYGTNPIFGAGGIGDYFSLIAWGFGSEATRAALVEMVKGWGVPGLTPLT